MDYKVLLKQAGSNSIELKKLFDEIISIEKKEDIDIIIESIKEVLFEKCTSQTLPIILDFVKSYYERFGNISPFLDSKFNSKIASSTSLIKNVPQSIIKSEWFFELIKPTNARYLSTSEFQTVIEAINFKNGVSLQEKASKYYKKVRSSISKYIDILIQDKNNIVNGLDEKMQECFIYFTELLLTDREYENNFIYYDFNDLTAEENKKLHDLARQVEKSLLIIKLYADLAISELFEATPTVVYKDMLEMLYFNESLPEEDRFLSSSPIVDDLNIIDMYLNTVFLATMGSTSEMDEFIENLKAINIKERFYDDMLVARRKSEELLRTKLYSFTELDECNDLEINEKWPGVKIYDLRDPNKQYNLVVRRQNKFDKNFSETHNGGHRFECYSYINDKYNHAHSTKGRNLQSPESFNYGYYNIEPDHLVFSSQVDSNTDPYDSNMVANEQSILADGEFSLVEINIANDVGENGYIPKSPDYIIAYKDIDEYIYNESLRLNIPIVLLNPRSIEEYHALHFEPCSPYYKNTVSVDANSFSEVLNDVKTRSF